MSSQLTTSRMVGVGIGKYDHLPPLDRAVSDVTQVADRLGSRGFATVTSLDRDQKGVLEDLLQALPADGMRRDGTVLVVLWSGHANQNTSTGTLRLLTSANTADEVDAGTFTADELAEIAARSGAGQLLMLIDTCQSGQAVVDMARVVDAVQRTGVDRAHRWMGIVASCQDYERAVDGALTRKLLHLLEHGPEQPELRMRWSSYQAGLRGDDLIDALVKEWGPEERQFLKTLSGGDPWLVLPNPLFNPNATDQVVEHLLWAARGGSPMEAGIWFVGRQRPLAEVVSWLGAGEAGMCVITGPAGCGKSAVAGRLVSLSNPAERGEILAAQGPPPAGLDPGEHSIDAHAQVRGLTLERCAEVLARSLGVVSATPTPNHHDLLAWASARETPPRIVVDGLDEAGEESFMIATDLLAPLSRYAQVLVSSREVAGVGASQSLLDSLGPAALEIDLDADQGETDRDVHDYVTARLRSATETSESPAMDVDLVAREIVSLARSEDGKEGPFLLARLITAQVIDHRIDTADPAWRTQLAQTVEEALERDLSTSPPLKRGEEELPQAGHELLTALAYSYGAGFPVDDVWPAVASALSTTGTGYDRLDAFWILGEHGRYVTASGQNGQAVYRLHERVASSLRAVEEEGPPRAAGRLAREVVGMAVLSVYERFLELGKGAAEHAYLWLYAWRHAADAGPAGIEVLERLIERDAGLAPDLAMALDRFADDLYSRGGDLEAVAPAERAVEIYEGLAKEAAIFLNHLASSLNNLGIRYSRVGKRAEAVAPAERAVEIYEGLAKDNPAFISDLAGALNNLGVRYGEVGERAEAVAPTERSVEIRERLAAENPAFLGDLAGSLNNLGIRYSEVGKRAEAVAPTERAVEIYQGLAKDKPVSLNELASALNNLGIRYSEFGRRAEAVAPTERAVEIRERLAAENPAFLGDLGGSLSNLGVRYSEVGKRAEAVAPTERAVEIYQGLAAENPAFLNDLASALNNLGIRYSEFGRRAEAVAPTERAVGIRERLAAENPAFLGELGGSLNNLGIRYSEVGKRAEAVAPTERAVEIYQGLAKDNPAFLNELARSLNNLGNRYSAVGKRDEAVSLTERAVEIREELVAMNPAFLGELASSLNNLGIRYSDVGRRDEVVAPTERAVEIYEGLAKDNPAFLGELARSLNNLGISFSELKRGAEAVAPTERAVEIYEGLAKDNPAFLGDLADSLNHLGVRYGAVGKRDEAVMLTERAVEIYEGLVERDPAIADDLAGALNNLGNRYSEIGKQDEAVAPTERAVEIYEGLVERDPAIADDLAGALNNLDLRYREAGRGDDGRGRWDAVLERFDSVPAVGATLRLRRLRSAEESDEAFDDLAEALALDTKENGLLTWELHQACRSLRGSDGERFDARWRERIGELAAWLPLDDATMTACGEWLGTSTWDESREYLKGAELLFSDAGLLALDDYRLLYPEREIARHREILETSRREGIDRAYRPLLTREIARAWRALDDPETSREFLLEHRQELLTPDAVLTLKESGDLLHSAVLDLAGTLEPGDLDLAYDLWIRRASREDALVAARRGGDFGRLSSTATLCLGAAGDATGAAFAVIHLAIAKTAQGSAEEALELAAGIQKLDVSPAPLIGALTDVIGHHPEHATGFAELIATLNRVPADPDPDQA